MPIYEYACRGCGDEFELLVRGQEGVVCPNCGTRELERQFSVVAAHRGASRDLPVCEAPAPGGCGLPQCGSGQCAFE